MIIYVTSPSATKKNGSISQDRKTTPYIARTLSGRLYSHIINTTLDKFWAGKYYN